MIVCDICMRPNNVRNVVIHTYEQTEPREEDIDIDEIKKDLCEECLVDLKNTIGKFLSRQYEVYAKPKEEVKE